MSNKQAARYCQRCGTTVYFPCGRCDGGNLRMIGQTNSTSSCEQHSKKKETWYYSPVSVEFDCK